MKKLIIILLLFAVTSVTYAVVDSVFGSLQDDMTINVVDANNTLITFGATAPGVDPFAGYGFPLLDVRTNTLAWLDFTNSTYIDDVSASWWVNPPAVTGFWSAVDHLPVTNNMAHQLSFTNYGYADISTMITPLANSTQGALIYWYDATDNGWSGYSYAFSRDADTAGTMFGVKQDYATDDRIEVNLDVDGTRQWAFEAPANWSDDHNGTFVMISIVHDGTNAYWYWNDQLGTVASRSTETDNSVWMKGIITDASNPVDVGSFGAIRTNSTVGGHFIGEAGRLMYIDGFVTAGMITNLFDQTSWANPSNYPSATNAVALRGGFGWNKYLKDVKGTPLGDSIYWAITFDPENDAGGSWVADQGPNNFRSLMGAGGAAPTKQGEGDTNGVIYFGGNDYVYWPDIGFNTSFSNEFTFSCWAKHTSADYGNFYGKYAGGSTPRAPTLGTDNTGKLRFLTGSTPTIRLSADTMNDGNWHMVTFRFKGSAGVQDVLIDGMTNNGSLSGVVPANMGYANKVSSLGALSQTVNPYTGTMDFAIMFTNAITDAQISNLWTYGRSGMFGEPE